MTAARALLVLLIAALLSASAAAAGTEVFFLESGLPPSAFNGHSIYVLGTLLGRPLWKLDRVSGQAEIVTTIPQFGEIAANDDYVFFTSDDDRTDWRNALWRLDRMGALETIAGPTDALFGGLVADGAWLYWYEPSTERTTEVGAALRADGTIYRMSVHGGEAEPVASGFFCRFDSGIWGDGCPRDLEISPHGLMFLTQNGLARVADGSGTPEMILIATDLAAIAGATHDAVWVVQLVDGGGTSRLRLLRVPLSPQRTTLNAAQALAEWGRLPSARHVTAELLDDNGTVAVASKGSLGLLRPVGHVHLIRPSGSVESISGFPSEIVAAYPEAFYYAAFVGNGTRIIRVDVGRTAPPLRRP
ncbi:MAG: hypothetical protein ACRD2J_08005 [Thermoanaerobaculia bacterium]